MQEEVKNDQGQTPAPIQTEENQPQQAEKPIENQQQQNEQQQQQQQEAQQQSEPQQQQQASPLQAYKNKIQIYIEEFGNLLGQQLPICPVRNLDEQKLKEKFEQLLEVQGENEQKQILKYLCHWQVENYNEGLQSLIEKIKGYCQEILQKFKLICEEKQQAQTLKGVEQQQQQNDEGKMQTEPEIELQQQQITLENPEEKQNNKNFMEIYEKTVTLVNSIQYDEFVPQIGYETKDYGYQNNIAVPVQNEQAHKIIEMKLTDLYDFTDDIEEVKYQRNIRKFKKDLLIQLNKLIKIIQKTKNEKDVSKIDDIFTKYQQCKAKHDNPPPKQVKKPKKTVLKSNKKLSVDGNESDSSQKSVKKVKKSKNTKIVGEEDNIAQDIKKMKIESSNSVTPQKKGKKKKGEKSGSKSRSQSAEKEQNDKDKKEGEANKSIKKSANKEKDIKPAQRITNWFQIKPSKTKTTPNSQNIQQNSQQPSFFKQQQNTLQFVKKEEENQDNTQQNTEQQETKIEENVQNNNNSVKMELEIPQEKVEFLDLNNDNSSFNKMQIKVETNIQQQPKQNQGKPLFRCYGKNHLLLSRQFESQYHLDQFEKVLKEKQGQQNLNIKEEFSVTEQKSDEQSEEDYRILQKESRTQKSYYLKNRVGKRVNVPKHVRKIFLIYSDSRFGYRNIIFQQKSQTVKPRNQIIKDDEIDYDKDSEEEFEDAQGDDVNDDGSEEDEDSQSVVEGFRVVPDGYLSDDEGCGSDDENAAGGGEGKKENKNSDNYNLQFEKKLEKIKNQEDKSYFYEFKSENITQLDSKIMKICEESTMIIMEDNYVLPLSLKKDQKEKELKKQNDPFTQHQDKYKEFIQLLHGSYKSRDDIISEFAEKNSEFIKNQLKKKVKEIAVKEKVGDEKTKRFVVYKTYFEKLGFEDEEPDKIMQEKKELFQKEEDEKKKKRAEEKKAKKEKERQEKIEQQKKEKSELTKDKTQIQNFMNMSIQSQKEQERLQEEQKKLLGQECEIILEEDNSLQNKPIKETPCFSTAKQHQQPEQQQEQQQQEQQQQMQVEEQVQNISEKQKEIKKPETKKEDSNKKSQNKEKENQKSQKQTMRQLTDFFKKIEKKDNNINTNANTNTNTTNTNNNQNNNINNTKGGSNSYTQVKQQQQEQKQQQNDTVQQTQNSTQPINNNDQNQKKPKEKKESKPKLTKEEKEELKELKKEISKKDIVTGKRTRKPAAIQYTIDMIQVDDEEEDEEDFDENNDSAQEDGEDIEDDEDSQEFDDGKMQIEE